jgi:predicted nucleic acid-binding protein
MKRIIVLDSGPLGLLANPQGSEASKRCTTWLLRLRQNGDQVAIPEIADYEVRRELTRIGATASLARLDRLEADAIYVPLTTAAMRQAAILWAQARKRGRPTADPHALDGDVILAAQASFLGDPDTAVIIATDNVDHLSQFADARRWPDI